MLNFDDRDPSRGFMRSNGWSIRIRSRSPSLTKALSAELKSGVPSCPVRLHNNSGSPVS